MRLFIYNLPKSKDEYDLHKLFAAYGHVRSAILVLDKAGRTRCFGFVQLEESDARRAILGLNGYVLDGRPITVREATPSRIERERAAGYFGSKGLIHELSSS